MRQNTRRQAPGKRAEDKADLSVAAGGYLDLGMVVTVYHASSAVPAPPGSAAEGVASFMLNDAGPCVTEH
ncbi:MAG TPA: hypothetical protein VEQ16_09465 [Acidocella sp.]|jgi:hypothetical protein|nr:hypothetical protein [Acidocella sp.]